jgi:membrane-associated phospholipid phosphatase
VLLPDTRCRGRQAAGVGYVSGHAAVAVALAAALLPGLGARGRAALVAIAGAVGLARMHAGAHLPLDVAGGAALGLAVDAAVGLAVAPPHGLG